MRQPVPMKEACERIFEICEQYKVPITQYKENNIPDGIMDNDDDYISISSISRQINFNSNDEAAGYFVQYLPRLRGATTLTEEEFDDLLNLGKRIQDCIKELNEYLNTIIIIEVE